MMLKRWTLLSLVFACICLPKALLIINLRVLQDICILSMLEEITFLSN